jgi:acyl dehydratase
MRPRTIADLRAGDTAEATHLVDDAMIVAFAELAGDRNPVHRDPAFAASTPFGRPIAPGLLTAALVSGVIGTHLPGPGSIYLSQSLRFTKPVMTGDRITARVEVLEVMAERNRVRLQTVCTNQHGDPVLVGEAWVMPPPAAARSVGHSARHVPLAA